MYVHSWSNVTLQNGYTTLHASAECGFVELTELLIDQYGMDPSSTSKVVAITSYIHTYIADYTTYVCTAMYDM